MSEIQRFGLIGKNIGYSFSATYFKEKFARENIHHTVYINFDIDHIKQFSEILHQHNDLRGLNVTIPYKQAIIPYLDTLSRNALKIGAVNTIKITKKGTLKGYNTDWYGFRKALLKDLKPHHKKALVLGTGGASKAIVFALQKMGIAHTLVSRTKQEHCFTYEELSADVMHAHTLIINTTPLGTFPNRNEFPPIPYQFLTADHLAFDLTYNPERSAFLEKAQAQQAQIQNGALMLKFQAEKAWSIWNKNSLILKISGD